MVKVIAIVKRKAGMPLDAFQEHWRTRHADVVRKLPGLRRYVQSHTLPSGYRKGDPVWDGIAELWFDDTEALRGLRGTPEQSAVDADEARFLERGAMKMLYTDDHVIKDGPIPRDGVKNIEFLQHRADLAIDAFQRYWRDVHGPIAAKIPQLRRYVQSHVRASAYAGGRTPAYDGLAITWFDDTNAMRDSAKTGEYARTRGDEPNFVAPDPPFIITREITVVG
jgi:uncharacterized protein (TIGR02118 family)